MDNKNILLLMILSLLIAFSVNGIYAMDTCDMEDFSSDLSTSNQDLIVADLDMGSDGDLAVSSSDSVDDDSDGLDYVCGSVVDDSESFGSISDSGSDDILSDDNVSPDLSNLDKGTVSGAVDIVAIHPWGPKDTISGSNGNINYLIPSNATNIKFAYVFVNIYSGSAQSTYGLFADINITTENGDFKNTENLWISSGSTDGTVYTLNDNVTKCYSDYMITYNITSLVQGLKDSFISVDVHSYPMENMQFDGRIKLISLVLGYDDGDSDEIYYWLNSGHSWTNSISYTEFDTASKISSGFFEANLTNIALSGNDGVYLVNNKVLYADESAGDIYQSGAYYQFHKWDVSDKISNGENSTVKYIASTEGYGSFKNIISLLIAKEIDSLDAHVSFETEPENTCYAGCENVLNITVNTNLKGKYTIRLLGDGKFLKSYNITLGKGTTSFLLVDNTIRSFDESNVGGDNNKVNYTVELSLNGNELDSYSIVVPIIKDPSHEDPANDSDAIIQTKITANAFSTTYGSGKVFTVKVLDVNGRPVSGIRLILKVYSGSRYVTRYITTNAQGIAKFSGASTLAIGSHKVVISSSNTKYAVSKTSSIKVSKASTVVSAKKVTAKYRKSAYFKVTVKNKATKKVVKGIKVKVKVYTGKKYKTYTIKTNSKGIAKLNTKKLKVGRHKVVISSKDSRYVIKKSSKIIIKR